MTAALILWAFYAGFALSISIYRMWVKGTLNLLNKLAFAPVIIAFGLADVLVNYTILSLIWGWPAKPDYTISARFEAYHKRTAPTPFAKTVATFTCEKLLNTIDPTGDHC
jgi:hypothetical protein